MRRENRGRRENILRLRDGIEESVKIELDQTREYEKREGMDEV